MPSVRYVAILALCLLPPKSHAASTHAGTYASMTSPAGIVEAMCRRFSACKTFQTELKDQMKIFTKGGGGQVQRKTGRILFIRPGMIRVDWADTDSFGPEGSASTNSIFPANGKYYQYTLRDNTAVVHDDRSSALGAAAGISNRLTAVIPLLLEGKSELANLNLLERLDDQGIEGRPCFHLKGTERSSRPGTEKVELWIAKDDLSLLRLDRSTFYSKADMEKTMKEVEEAMKKSGRSGFKMPPGTIQEFRSEGSTSYQGQRWDPPLSSKDLEFQTPKDVKIMSEDEYMKGIARFLGK
jgi:hypothetical protein